MNRTVIAGGLDLAWLAAVLNPGSHLMGQYSKDYTNSPR